MVSDHFCGVPESSFATLLQRPGTVWTGLMNHELKQTAELGPAVYMVLVVGQQGSEEQQSTSK